MVKAVKQSPHAPANRSTSSDVGVGRSVSLLLLGLLLLMPACSRGIPGATVRWKDVPYLAGKMPHEKKVAGATAIKAADDGKYLYVAAYGYSEPSEASNVIVPSDAGPQYFDRRIDYWQVVLDSDGLDEPRVIQFMPGPQPCTDPLVMFAEHKGMLELAYPVDAIVNTPVHVRVQRITRLFNGRNEAEPVIHSFPKDAAAVYSSQSPNLLVDQRIPRVDGLTLDELQCDSLALKWTSNKRVTSRVELAAEGQAPKTVCDLEPLSLRHNVLLRGLLPDVQYEVSVSGTDFAGNLAPPITGTFRTAVAAPGAAELGNLEYRAVPLTAPQQPPGASAAVSGVPHGLSIRADAPATWRIGRELTGGTLRLAMCIWHAADGQTIEIGAVRSGELPNQFRKIDTVECLKDGKLHQYDKILKIDTSFDMITLRMATGTAGPVTVFGLYEVTTKMRPR